MKKPKLIYLIAIWVYLMSVFYVSIPLGVLGKLCSISPDVIQLIDRTMNIPVIVLAVGLIQLRRLPRIITVILLAIASIVTVDGLTGLPFLEKQHPPKTYVGLSAFVAVNLCCIWYLSRRGFVALCTEYRRQVSQGRTVPPPGS